MGLSEKYTVPEKRQCWHKVVLSEKLKGNRRCVKGDPRVCKLKSLQLAFRLVVHFWGYQSDVGRVSECFQD